MLLVGLGVVSILALLLSPCAFADEWDAERDAGYPVLKELRERHAGQAVREFEESMRAQLGEGASRT